MEIQSGRWQQTPAAHRQFLDAAVPRLMDDGRIIGVCAGGSLMKGTVDEYSDLDLVVVVTQASRAEVMADRRAVAGKIGTLLRGFTGDHVGEPRLLICLYDSPLIHVDLKFVAPGELAERVEDPVILAERNGTISATLASAAAVAPDLDLPWIEDRFWIWIHYGVQKTLRGELFECLDHLAFIRGTVLGPMATAAVGLRSLPGPGVRRIESNAPSWAERLEACVAAHTRESCLAALEASTALYVDLRTKLKPTAGRSEEVVVREYLRAALGSTSRV